MKDVRPDHRLEPSQDGVGGDQDPRDDDDHGQRVLVRSQDGPDRQGDGVEHQSGPEKVEEDEGGCRIDPRPQAESEFQVLVGRAHTRRPVEGNEQIDGNQDRRNVGEEGEDIAPIGVSEGESGKSEEGQGADDGGHQGEAHDPARHGPARQEVAFIRSGCGGSSESR